MSESNIKKAIKNPKMAFRAISYKIDVFGGKILFKNNAGLTKNLEGRKTLYELSKYSKNYSNNDPKNPLSEEFQKNGHVGLGTIFDNSLIETIANKFNEIIEDEKISIVNAKHDGKTYSRNVPLLHKKIPEVVKLVNPQVIDFFEQYYNANIKILDVYGYRNYHIPKHIAQVKNMYSNDWHSDAHNITWTKFLVYLTDVTSDDGPFTTQSIARTKELIDQGFGDRTKPGLPKEILEVPKFVTVYTGSKGTALATNTELCLHRATIPTEGHFRDVLMIQFAPSRVPLEENWYESLEGNISKIKTKDL